MQVAENIIGKADNVIGIADLLTGILNARGKVPRGRIEQ